MKKLNYGLWYLFFSAYWTAYNWGEKRNPQSNATNFISITIALNLFLPFNVYLLLGHKVPGLVLFTFCFLPGLILPYILFRRRKIYEIKIKQFEFLKQEDFKRRRFTVLLVVTFWSIASFIGIGVLRILI